MAVYRYMDIGTAKPMPAERKAVPHYMIDVADPDENFDAAIYARQARAIADSLHKQNTPVFVVGGTGLYIKALIHGLFDEGRSDPALRASLKEQAKTLGMDAMHARLAEIDPESAKKIHPNDHYRILRALEVCTLTQKPVSAQRAAHGFSDSFYDVLIFCLHMDRAELYERVNKRVDAMLAQGLLGEVRGLLARGYDSGLKSMQSIGYRHICEHIAGRLDYEEAVSTLKQDTRRLAKRQLTWFRAYPEIKWVLPDQTRNMQDAIAQHLK